MTGVYADDQPASASNHIKNVAVVGAAGGQGSYITAELLKTGQHNVTAITRLESTSTFPNGIMVAKVNYDEHNSLTNAMRGQDALIITMNARAPQESVTKLVEAAVDANVPWILPNEWGYDYTDPDVNRDTMLGDSQLAIRKLIESKTTKTAWIAVACGFWYDYSLVAGVSTFGFDFENKEVTFYNDGTAKVYCSTLPYVGQAVAKLLSLPISVNGAGNERPCLEDYRNSIFRVHAFHISQADMLSSVLRVTGGKEGDWTIKHVTPEARYVEGKTMFEQRNMIGYRVMLYSRYFYPSLPVKKLEDYSDARLGLNQPSLDEVTKLAVDKAMEK
ncbi:hypothetical protein LTR64_004627 [Lithohypha guttulata]|uniref:uncharacterized protein n=1 Tax=Lithohypha guttulata TaxID=1690604 RepID=UPI002DDFCBCF|nr:hypothetical protein LTR51_006075 [Lithohypha guttulata]